MKESRLSILLVDDDEDDYCLTHALLNEVYGELAQVEWISNYEAARPALLSERHSLCLLDYHLGPRNGLELLGDVLAHGCRTPVILLTGLDDYEVDVKAMQVGAADYLVKGEFGTKLLERSIRYAMGFAVERQKTLDALRLSEERYALAVQGANDGLWDWDLTTDRVYYAPRWKSMLGYQEREVGDSPQEWFGRIHRLDHDRVEAEVKSHIAGNSTHLETQHRMLHQEGAYRWVLTRGLAVRDESGRAVRMAGSQSDITLRKAAEDRLQHDAFHDLLTGLPNRALLMDRLCQAVSRSKRRGDRQFAVIFLDIDRFKYVNDSLGHTVGDQLLVAISRRLERSVREGDTVARIGGDEFVVLIEDIERADVVFGLAEGLLNVLQASFLVEGRELVVSASLGIAFGGPDNGNGEEIVRNADIAMYKAKSRGKAGYAVFDCTMHSETVNRLLLETELRKAIGRTELRVHYQPIVSLRSGKVRSFEALLRWENPERGMVYPDEFVPMAEETKLILPIGIWVFRAAAEQLRKWQTDYWTTPPLTMSVNLSCRQFCQPDLIYQIESLLLQTKIDPRCLKMEITESTLMEQVESASSTLLKLKSLGVKLVLDDFGKGYSSLSYLHHLPFDGLKIDRSFVSRIGPLGENTEIVRTILSLARLLRLEVVAEGVESPSQVDQLKNLGCRLAQGYYFSRPLPPDEAEDILKDPARWLDAMTPAASSSSVSSRSNS